MTMLPDVSGGEPAPITPKQLREARELLGWSRNRLAAQSETTVGFIGGFEDTGQTRTLLKHPMKFDALKAIRTVIEHVGVEFIEKNDEGLGVRLRKLGDASFQAHASAGPNSAEAAEVTARALSRAVRYDHLIRVDLRKRRSSDEDVFARTFFRWTSCDL